MSDSKGLTNNTNLARMHLQHAHYVAASRVTSEDGLQILTWLALSANQITDLSGFVRQPSLLPIAVGWVESRKIPVRVLTDERACNKTFKIVNGCCVDVNLYLINHEGVDK